MASKKELEARIAKLEGQVRQLENMHARIGSADFFAPIVLLDDPFESYVYNGETGRYCGRQLTASELKTRWDHPVAKEPSAYTRAVPKVTLGELARFVLDGEPIRRKKEGKVEYITTYAPGVKTDSVKTDIGNISIENRTKG